MTGDLIIEWEAGNLQRAICAVIGHDVGMSNPAVYGCSRCNAIGRYHYEGHTKDCFHKYSNGECFCEGNWAPFEWVDDVYIARQGHVIGKGTGPDIWAKRRNAQAICNILNFRHADDRLTGGEGLLDVAVTDGRDFHAGVAAGYRRAITDPKTVNGLDPAMVPAEVSGLLWLQYLEGLKP